MHYKYVIISLCVIMNPMKPAYMRPYKNIHNAFKK